MITDHKDFLEQLNVIKQGIKIPAYDISKIMDSEEYNNYYADIEKSLNDLTGMIRSLEDCNQYMVTYVNDIVDKKYKELSDKLIALENNYSLYQNKKFYFLFSRFRRHKSCLRPRWYSDISSRLCRSTRRQNRFI